MAGFTKWIFAGLGWAIGGPIGALLGYFLGKAISPDKQLGSSSFGTDDAPHRGPYRNTGTQADINAALMVLIAAVMKVDGAVKRSELDYVKRFLLANYGEERGKEMLKVLQQMVERDIPIDQICLQIKVNTDYNTRYHMVDFLFGIGGADGEFHQSEINMLRLIAQYLGISQSDYTSIYERHVGSSAPRLPPHGHEVPPRPRRRHERRAPAQRRRADEGDQRSLRCHQAATTLHEVGCPQEEEVGTVIAPASTSIFYNL